MAPFNGELDSVEPIYNLPRGDLVGEVLNPALRVATTIAIGSGYFSSHALTKVSAGLAAAIESGSPVRLLLSPQLSELDWDAITRGTKDPVAVVTDVVERILENGPVTKTALESHAVDCLAYLIATDRLEIRFVLMPTGMFHKKQWLISQDTARLAVHGSGNATIGGLFVNGEQMSVDRDWCDGETAIRKLDILWHSFENDWNNTDPATITVTAEAAVDLLIPPAVRDPNSRPPTVANFWAAWKADHDAGKEPPLPDNIATPPRRLITPSTLQWRDGRYGHQGRAVNAYLNAGDRGILAMATGGGKTKTSLIIASHVQDRNRDRPLLLVILVPSKPLVRQWVEDVTVFGITPTVLADIPAVLRRTRIDEIEAALLAGGDRTEVIVDTIKLFARDERFRTLVERASGPAVTMLIADEVHNFGSPQFINNPPDTFDVRLGLSATPVRQYDADGTAALFDFFGPQIFEFSLAEAIESGCLVEYDYVIHRVDMTNDEMDRYRELTEELVRAGFMIDDDGRPLISNSKIERLLRRRRAVLEQASGKLEALRTALEAAPVTGTLIYCSAKELELAEIKQIRLVNRLLSDLDIIAHELTSVETGSGRAPEILDRFAAGDYQALTAMKVLDEGVDIPATQVAYILASTTVEREWVQRRGRVLRYADGKTHAVVHDFIVVPPDNDPSAKSVLRGEIRRAREFAQVARNRWSDGGPVFEIESLEELLRE